MPPDVKNLPSLQALLGPKSAHEKRAEIARSSMEKRVEACLEMIEPLVYKNRKSDYVFLVISPDSGEISLRSTKLKGGPEAFTIGSGKACDLSLSSEPSLEDQHCLILIKSGEEAEAKVVDLRSDKGIVSPSGKAFHSYGIVEPSALYIGRSVLFILPFLNKPFSGRTLSYLKSVFSSLMFEYYYSYFDTELIPVDLDLSLKRRSFSLDSFNVGGLLSLSIGEQTSQFVVKSEHLKKGVLIGGSGDCDLRVDHKDIRDKHGYLIDFDGDICYVDLDPKQKHSLFAMKKRSHRLQVIGDSGSIDLQGSVTLHWHSHLK